MNKLSTLLILFLQFGVLAQSNDFKYSRAISEVEKGWYRIALSPDIFQHLNSSYSDLRIIGISESGDSIEAPYLLRTLEPVFKRTNISFQTLNRSKNAGKTSITFELNNIIPVNQIQLDIANRNYDWKIKLEGSQDLNEWNTILEDYRIISIDNDQVEFNYSTLEIPRSKYRYYRLTIPTTEEVVLTSTSISENEVISGNYHFYSPLIFTQNDDKTNQNTELVLKLKEKVPVSSISLTVSNDFDYYRPIHIETLIDSTKTEKGWHYNYKTLDRGILSSFNNQEFVFKETVCSHVRITIENHDNSPLDITNIEAKGYKHELVTRIDEVANYHLLYGNSDISKPIYDIVNFKDQIPSSMPAATLGGEIKRVIATANEDAEVEQTKIPGFWMWLVLGILILMMGIFAIRMIRKA